MPKWSQNHLKFNTLAFRGAHLYDFRKAFETSEKLYNFQSSLDAQKGSKIDQCGTQGGEGGAKGWKSGKAWDPGTSRDPLGPPGITPPPSPPELGARADPPEPSQAQLS